MMFKKVTLALSVVLLLSVTVEANNVRTQKARSHGKAQALTHQSYVEQQQEDFAPLAADNQVEAQAAPETEVAPAQESVQDVQDNVDSSAPKVDEAMRQPEEHNDEPLPSQAFGPTEMTDEQREFMRLAGEADVFLMGDKGKIEFLGKEAEGNVQKTMHDRFQQEMQTEEKRELAKVKKNEKKGDMDLDLDTIVESKHENTKLVVNGDSSMTAGTSATAVPETKKKKESAALKVKFEVNEYPYVLQPEERHLHFYDEGIVEKEDMEAKMCISLFEECNYKGKNLLSCADNPINLSQFPLPIKSIYVPDGSQLTMYEEFEGKILAITNSVKCLEKPVSLAATPTRLELRFTNGVVYED